MKESQLYFDFIKRNLVSLFVPIILVLIISIYFYAQVPSQVRISQTFKMNYSIENIDSVLALSDQAVAQLRSQRFAAIFPDATASIYKSAPLNISIESTSLTRDTSYTLLLKQTEYLRQNFQVEELTSPEITQIEPNLFKYLVSGLIIGGLVGLVISLVREYLRNY